MDLYDLLGVSRLRLITKLGIPEYHYRYAHLGAVRRFLRYHIGL